ncbi:MAG TPA: hypothetical protein VE338_04255, partial [Ktedonobacterales bacterium]|nr:hypothetical protein [Ktedonobacterales bacterium]
MDESHMDESRMDLSLSQPSARASRRRPYRPVAFLLFALLVALLVTVTLRQSLDGASTPANRGSTNSVATDAPSSTPTPSAPFAFLDQALKTTTSLRGSYAFRYIDSSADGSVLYVIVELPAPPTLADAQWDAFVIQRMAWSTPDAQPHTG